MSKDIIESIRDYFKTCPLLDKKARINVDYIGDKVIEYAIYPEPIEPWYKRYLGGGGIRQFGFTFTTVNYLSAETQIQLANSGFSEKLINWIVSNNDKGILPDIKGIVEIQILTNGFLSDTSTSTAMYQIQMKLLYVDNSL